MKIEAVDFFYLSMPTIKDIGDGSQDALLVRVQAGPHTGWQVNARTNCVPRAARASRLGVRSSWSL